MKSQELDLADSKKQAEYHQNRLMKFFNQVPGAVCILDGPSLIYEMVNSSYQSLFPGRNLLGRSVYEALPEIIGTPVQEMLENVYKTGETFEGKEVLMKLARNEGGLLEDIYFNFMYQARYDLENCIDGIQVFAYEVTELVLARNAKEEFAFKIEQQAKIFDTALSAIADFVYMFGLDGRFTYSNKPLTDLLGITLDQIIGKNFHDLPYPLELAEKLQLQIAQVIKECRTVSDETPYINPEGKLGYYEYIFTPIFDDMGKVVLVAGSTRDISERKKAEESILKKNQELIKVNNEMDNFIYTASHDLKAPISNIEGLLIALKRSLPQESLKIPMVEKLLPMIQTSIERFKQTLLDLTEVVKVQRMTDEDLSDIDLTSTIEDIQSDLFIVINEANATIQLEIGECPPIRFSRKNLRSILYNLISNSIKYRSEDRTPFIKINCKIESGFHILTIEDNGLGMDLNNKTSVFGMFKRLHNHVEGTGLGLYIVKKIIDNAGGSIEVESKVNVGTIFKIYLKAI